MPEQTEKEILENLKKLEKEGRERLASLRRQRHERRPRQNHTGHMNQFLNSRKIAGKKTALELFLVNQLLDRDDLAPNDRKNLKRRRKNVHRHLTLDRE